MLGMYPPVIAFATVGMEHVIANMFFLPTAVFTGAAEDYGFWLWKNLIPAALGNTLGGAFLAFCYWFTYLTEDVRSELSSLLESEQF
jgi:formate transporter